MKMKVSAITTLSVTACRERQEEARLSLCVCGLKLSRGRRHVPRDALGKQGDQPQLGLPSVYLKGDLPPVLSILEYLKWEQIVNPNRPYQTHPSRWCLLTGPFKTTLSWLGDDSHTSGLHRRFRILCALAARPPSPGSHLLCPSQPPQPMACSQVLMPRLCTGNGINCY